MSNRLIASASSFVFSATQALLIILFPLMAEIWKLNLASIVGIFSWGTLLFLGSAPFWTKRSDFVGRGQVLKIGLAGLLVSFVSIAFLIKFPFSNPIFNFIGLFFSRTIYGIFASCIAPISQTIHAENSSVQNSARSMFTHSISLSLGRVVGFASLAFLIHSLHEVIYIFAVLTFAVFILSIMIPFKLNLTSLNLVNQAEEQAQKPNLQWVLLMALL